MGNCCSCCRKDKTPATKASLTNPPSLPSSEDEKVAEKEPKLAQEAKKLVKAKKLVIERFVEDMIKMEKEPKIADGQIEEKAAKEQDKIAAEIAVKKANGKVHKGYNDGHGDIGIQKKLINAAEGAKKIPRLEKTIENKSTTSSSEIV